MEIFSFRKETGKSISKCRVQATSRFMTWGMMPVAAFLAGVLSAQIGTGTVILIGGCLSTVAAFIYLHPSLRD